uniref:Uncharacterized protein n=1 Tax=Cucumis melo TaxID=3656 RepID=A0A9I9CZA9_CUCME
MAKQYAKEKHERTANKKHERFQQHKVKQSLQQWQMLPPAIQTLLSDDVNAS